MKNHHYADVAVGDALPSYTSAPITRTTLALYAGASGDHNPIHIDIDFAKSAGMPDVFVHGMYSMACMAQTLTNWVRQDAIRSIKVRFSAITHLRDELTCTAKVVEKDDAARTVKLEIRAANAKDETKLFGEAVIALPA